MGEKTPYPPFYEKVHAGGSRVVPDAVHMTAISFIDVAVFNRKPSLRTVFHTLVHVAQYSAVGVNAEEQAYQLDARYIRDTTDVFSVEGEVSEWMLSGKFKLGEQS